jgi:glutaminase
VVLSEVLQEIGREVRPHLGKGRVAAYIPALRKVPADKFGMAVRTVDGAEHAVGDAAEPFSIQSVSKLFTLILAMNTVGDELWTRVGKEPSGTPFNSLVQLEYEDGRPRNPFLNAGALVVLDCVMQRAGARTVQLIVDYARVLSQNFAIAVDEDVASSERRVAHRNAAIAHLLCEHGRIASDPQALLDAYCRQCALAMSCQDLCRAFLPLANRGLSPVLGEGVLTERQARRINALMMTCGMYDATGSFAFRVGIPAKSGVGGGIVAIVPQRCAVAVWSPGLDRSGNSLAGTAALELFVRMTDYGVL